jgi:hypothetical protein
MPERSEVIYVNDVSRDNTFAMLRFAERTPVRAIYKIASSTLRNSVARRRPKRLAAGMCGSISTHSASVRSLA